MFLGFPDISPVGSTGSISAFLRDKEKDSENKKRTLWKIHNLNPTMEVWFRWCSFFNWVPTIIFQGRTASFREGKNTTCDQSCQSRHLCYLYWMKYSKIQQTYLHLYKNQRLNKKEKQAVLIFDFPWMSGGCNTFSFWNPKKQGLVRGFLTTMIP